MEETKIEINEFDEESRELTTYNYLHFEYFVGYEITSLLGYKDTNQTIRNNVSKSNKLVFRDFPGVKIPELDPRTILITPEGVIEILIKTRKCISPDVLHILKKFNIDTTNKKCLTKEQRRDEEIEDVKKEITELKEHIVEKDKTLNNIITNVFNTETETKTETVNYCDEESRELTTYFYISNYLHFEYFVGYEIASLLGYKNTRDVIINNVSKSNQLVFRDFPGVKMPELDPRTILITPEGAIEILIKTRKRISPDVLHILKKFNIDTTNKKCLTKEQQTLSAIANAFKSEKIEDQYKIGNYFLDMYFPEYKIVIECDENGHSDRRPSDERERMDYVNETLKIDDSHWIRFNPDEYDFDLSKVIGKIYRKINDIKETESRRHQICVADIAKIFERENPVLDYEIGEYKVDLFFPNHKVIFDFDKYDTTRINYINTFLEIDLSHWIIFNEKSETFDIARAIGQLYILMKEKEIFVKMCCTCRKEKPSSDFYKSKNTSDGLGLRCKECRSKLKVNKNEPKPKVETPESKICPECDEEKLSLEYWKNPSRKDGLDSVCIDCRKKQNQKIIDAPKIVLEMKKCSTCKETKKTITDFFRRKKSFDGYNGVCKVCTNNRKNILYETKIVKY
jgi:very-short-patch-repair endonuclease/prophage antirepressor-like protein